MRYFIKLALPCLACGLFAIGVFTNASAQTSSMHMMFDSLKAANEIAAQNVKYAAALKNTDSVTLANLYTKDAKMLMDGDPTTSGRTAIKHFYSGMISHGVTTFSYVTTGVWGGNNNLVIEEGTLTFALASGQVAAKGRYILIWKRENGELKIFRDTYFSDPK